MELAPLLNLYRSVPGWPAALGRCGPIPESWNYVVGDVVRLSDGREGRLRAIEYDTRTGRLRCCVEIEGRRHLFDPEDLLPCRLTDVADRTSV